MEKIYNEIIDEELYTEKLENGLEIYYIPKKGFKRSYAILGVDFGSIDLEFVPRDKTEKIRVNEGIAHFLEHKMFEQPDGSNVFKKFSDYGANANAYTNFDKTAYLFSCTDNFYKSLRYLIEYVQTPYYTEENVEKEKGIIEQEIKMYKDDPGQIVYNNVLKAMYHNHYVNMDIGGSIESVNRITPEELYICYDTFYNPSNMKLVIAGDLDFEKIIDTVKKAGSNTRTSSEKIKRFYPDEPISVKEHTIVQEATVSMPSFYIGYKDKCMESDPFAALKKEIVSDIVFDMIFSESGELFNGLYREGLLNTPIYGGYMPNRTYSYALAAGYSKDPEEVKKRTDAYIEKLKREGTDAYEFEVNKKKKIGGFLKSFDSIESLTNNFLNYIMKGINILDYLEVLRNIKHEDVDKRLREFFNKEESVISIVKPAQNIQKYSEEDRKFE